MWNANRLVPESLFKLTLTRLPRQRLRHNEYHRKPR